ncbi:MAG: hypothetical protein KDA85_20155, partial [Planctomycetaceae bacterium]|nr:hypothetical protein [Planctomycetaceae bacterium]
METRAPSIVRRGRRWAERNPRAATLAFATGFLLIAVTVISTGAALSLSQSWTRERNLRVAAETAEETAQLALARESAALVSARAAEEAARQQASIAAQEAQQSAETQHFLQSLLQGSDPLAALFNPIGGGPAAPPSLQTILADARGRIDTELSAQPMVQARLMDVMANACRALGQYAEAEQLLNEAAGKRERVMAAAGIPTEEILRDQARHQLFCGWLKQDQSQWPIADAYYTAAMLLIPETDSRDNELLKADVLFQQGRLMLDSRRTVGRTDAMQESLVIRSRWLTPNDNTVQASRIGVALMEAESVAQIPLEQILTILQSGHWASELGTVYTQGLLSRRSGHLDQAVACYEQVIDGLSGVLPERHPLRILATGDFVGLLYEQGNYRRAFPLALTVIGDAEQLNAD